MNLCDMGTCRHTHTIRDRYEFEAKTYPVEDSVFIRRRVFAKAQILQNAIPLEDEAPDTGEVAGNGRQFVSFNEDVQTRQRLFRETIKSKIKSKVNSSKGATDCGFDPGTTTKGPKVDRFLTIQTVFQDDDFCINEFIKTWRQSGLGRGVMRDEGDMIVISDEVEIAMLRESKITWDRHAFGGDYASANEDYSHTDGYFKIANAALGDAVEPIYNWLFTGDLTGLCIDLLIGGKQVSIPFNTSLSDTLDDVVTELTTAANGYVDQNGVNLWTVVTNVGGDTLHIEGQKGVDLQVRIVITNCDGFMICIDQTLLANTPITVTGVAVVLAVTQEFVDADTPISIDILSIDSANVFAYMTAMYEEIVSKKPEILEPDFGANWMLARNIWHALVLAEKEETKAFLGTCDVNPTCPEWMGVPISRMNYMPNDFMLIARPEDLHAGTDLVQDVAEIKTGFDEQCETAWWKNKFNMGFQISQLDQVAGTFSEAAPARLIFQPAQPLDPQ